MKPKGKYIAPDERRSKSAESLRRWDKSKTNKPGLLAHHTTEMKHFLRTKRH